MDFLFAVPDLALSEDGGKQCTFCADIFDTRPPFEEMQRFASWGAEIQAQMQMSLQRRICPVKWVGLFVDQKGMLALFQFNDPVILGHAKTSAEVIMQARTNNALFTLGCGLWTSLTNDASAHGRHQPRCAQQNRIVKLRNLATRVRGLWQNFSRESLQRSGANWRLRYRCSNARTWRWLVQITLRREHISHGYMRRSTC